MNLAHRAGCPAQRVESWTTTAPTGRWRVWRCVDCGQQAELRLAAPTAEADVDLQPNAVARALSPAERFDPALNPLHPHAGVAMRRPT